MDQFSASMVRPMFSPACVVASLSTGSSWVSSMTSVIVTTMPYCLRLPETSSVRNAVDVGVTPSTSGVVAALKVLGRRNLIVVDLFLGMGLVMPNLSRTTTGAACFSICRSA